MMDADEPVNQKINKERNPRVDQFLLSVRILVRNPAGAVGLAILVAYLSIALIVQFIPGVFGITSPFTMIPNYANPFPIPPGGSYPLGTTFPGINLYDAVIKAIRTDVFSSMAVVITGAVVGSLIGTFAGYMGKYVDELAMRVTDIFFSLPFLVLALAIGFIIGRALGDVLIALMIVWWPIYARLTRSQALFLKDELYVKYSLISGNSTMKTLFRHIFPNALTPVLVQMSVDLANVILLLSGLYFIGFASSSPYLPELGSLINDGFPYALTDPWTVVVPGVFLMIFALGMNLFGDGLRDALDPRFRT